MVDKIINDKTFRVDQEEFSRVPHPEYNNLEILQLLGFYERTAGLLRDLTVLFGTSPHLVCQGVCMGGWLPITLSPEFEKIYLFEDIKSHCDNINRNLSVHSVKNIYWERREVLGQYILFIDNKHIDEKLIEHIRIHNPIVLSVNKLPSLYRHHYRVTRKYTFAGEKDLNLYIPDNLHSNFVEEFKYYIDNSYNLDYDNLIHLCIMVKNGGESFEKVLTENLPFIDRWTILDTGSTDNTVEIINKVLVGKKKGQLYQEPFINFRDSRNRCLELAGVKCKYTLMLDDTYIAQGELRDFLNTCRGDQFGTSYSMYIKSDDSEYTSNRIIKTANRLRYIYKIHEVIQPQNNTNVCIPISKTHVFDYRCDYMENRTMGRKEYDLKLLFEEVEENPDDPRHSYYIAQTYNLLEKYELALEYFLKRANHPVDGFLQEKADALFEAARICNFKLDRPWDECERLYMRSFEIDTSRPESLYFIGIHFYLNNIFDKAYDCMKKAYQIGYPVHTQHSLKPTLSFHYLPKFLAELSYRFKDWKTGFDCSCLFLEKNKKDCDSWETMVSWKNIFYCLQVAKPLSPNPKVSDKPYICFVADGGFEKWTGRDILTKGMGGSETFIVEISKYIKQFLPDFNVVVFCNTPGGEYDVFGGVEYRPIIGITDFFADNIIKHCIVSRYSEYIPLAMEGHVENIYLILHDLSPTGTVIPSNSKIKKIFCLTEWHVDYFTNLFPVFKDITVPFYYGIDSSIFPTQSKIPYKFIYSSTANRGLIILLELWPRIVERYKNASLEIFCDLENSWVNNTAPDQVKQIKNFLKEYRLCNYNITLRGWSSKKELAESWSTADVWFYPCIFAETFCMTALEAAVSKTIVVTNDLAGLKQTVRGDTQGVVIPGNAATQEWKENAIRELFAVLDDSDRKQRLVESNYKWAVDMTWKSRAEEMIAKYLFEEKHVYITTDLSTQQSSESDLPDKNVLSNLCLYYNFRNNTRHTEVLMIGKSSEVFCKELINVNIEVLKVEDMDKYLELDNKNYKLIYLDYPDISYIDYCLMWKILEIGGFIIANSNTSAVDKFISKYDNSINVINRNSLIVLEKIN